MYSYFKKLTENSWGLELRYFAYDSHNLATYSKHGHDLLKNSSIAVIDTSSAFINVPANIFEKL